MQFQPDNLDHPISIRSFEPSRSELCVVSKIDNKFNTKILNTSTIVLFDNIIENWAPKQLSDLSSNHIQQILQYNPEILIFGVGDKLSPIAYPVLEPLYVNKIPFEVMTTINACRTYNLLASEHRKVAVALII